MPLAESFGGGFGGLFLLFCRLDSRGLPPRLLGLGELGEPRGGREGVRGGEPSVLLLRRRRRRHLLLPFLFLVSLVVASPTPVGRSKPETFLPRESPVVGQVRSEVEGGGPAAASGAPGAGRGRGVVALAAVVVVGSVAGSVFVFGAEQPPLYQHPAHALRQGLPRRSRMIILAESSSCLPAATLPGGAEEAGRRRRRRRQRREKS